MQSWTAIFDCLAQPPRFGFRPTSRIASIIQYGQSMYEITPYPHIKPAEKAVEKVKTRINEISARNQTWRPTDEIVRDMNRMLRGWLGYFHFSNSSAVFLKVKTSC
jgi:hypothetical protein